MNFVRTGRILSVVFLACSLACSRSANEDEVVNVSPDDAEMNAAIANARETLPKFWDAFNKRSQGEEYFALKVRVTDGTNGEHFWVGDLERKDGKIYGTIDNEPELVKTVKLGERITVPEADISDWLFKRQDKMVGNFTIRPLFKSMPPEEVEKFKRILVEP